ncbi:MAG: MerR family transcriptional regulator [Dehalococcoidia bacterium]|nr:MAG: MerR family transcriptional regulator [Dehalococcoidia bacterium]
MIEYEDSQPRYVISVAARMLGVHAQTLRYYERAGMIEPSRSRGNRRLYSMDDIERLRRIKTLIDDLGVNLAGVEVIIRMGERMAEMERWMRMMELELRRLS